MFKAGKITNKQLLRGLAIAILLVCMGALTTGSSLAQVPQTGCYELWDTTLTVSDALGASQTLTFGQGLFATNGVDLCDQLAPPPPPAGSFYAQWLNVNGYFTDYRPANLPGIVTWTVDYRAATGGDPITLSWNPTQLPGAGTWTLQDQFGGILVNVNMALQSSLVVPNAFLTQLFVIYNTTRCTVTAVADGDWGDAGTWNTNCSGVPTATDDVYIPGDITVNFNNAPTTIGTLTVGNDGSLLFANSNQLTVAGNAFNRGGTLNLGALGNLLVNGSLSNYGSMSQTKTVAPSATFLDVGGYGGLTLTANDDPLGETLVRIQGGDLCDTDNTSSWRCFSILPATSAADAEVTFYFAEEELNASECATMSAWRSTGGNNWVPAGTFSERSCAAEPYSLTYSGVTIEEADGPIIQNNGSIFALRSEEAPTAVNLLAIQANTPALGWASGAIGLLLLVSAVVLLRPGSPLRKRG